MILPPLSFSIRSLQYGAKPDSDFPRRQFIVSGSQKRKRQQVVSSFSAPLTDSPPVVLPSAPAATESSVGVDAGRRHQSTGPPGKGLGEDDHSQGLSVGNSTAPLPGQEVVVELNVLASPAGHALLYAPETVDQVADILLRFLARHITSNLEDASRAAASHGPSG